MWSRGASLAVLFVLLLPWRPAAAADWTPEMWVDENTLEVRTTDPGEEPHWSPVWVAVIDNQLYVRLGDRAASRVERNVNKPYLGLRIAGQEFPRVRGEPAPEMAGRVAAEIKEKYWSDVFIRFFSHPLTLRLVREEAPHEEPPHEDAPHADQSQRATD